MHCKSYNTDGTLQKNFLLNSKIKCFETIKKKNFSLVSINYFQGKTRKKIKLTYKWMPLNFSLCTQYTSHTL